MTEQASPEKNQAAPESEQEAPDRDQKEVIADAFEKHFSEFGYKKTSMDDVAKDVKVSKKTLYRLFESKEKAFYHIVSRAAHRTKNRLEKDLEQCGSNEEKLGLLTRLIIVRIRTWLKTNVNFEFKYSYKIPQIAFRDAISELIQSILRDGMDKGEFGEKNLDTTTHFIVGILSEAIAMLRADLDKEIEDEVAVAVLRVAA